jgi:hypothetical protein
MDEDTYDMPPKGLLDREQFHEFIIDHSGDNTGVCTSCKRNFASIVPSIWCYICRTIPINQRNDTKGE